MHYDDPYVTKNANLKIVIYKHNDLTTPGAFDFELTSIQECKFINPNTLQKMLSCYEYILESFLKTLPEEEFILIEIKFHDAYDADSACVVSSSMCREFDELPVLTLH
jgi:hypothetical protein